MHNMLSYLRKHGLSVAVVIAVLMGVAAWAVSRWQGPQVETETVQRRDFVQTVVASGHVESPHRVDIGSQITSTVTRVPVQEGDTVQAGSLLVELASTELQAADRQATLAVRQAEGKLRLLREVQAPVAEQTLRQAQASLATAQAAYVRQQQLFQQGFIGQAALDESRKAAELADAQQRAAQKQRDSAASGSDLALAQGAIEEARAAQQAAQARAAYTQIRAPLAGVLIGRNVEVGDVVQPGKVLMTLSPQGRVQVRVSIDEKNLHLIRLGQKALVSADAYAQHPFAAELVYINPGVNAQTGAVDVKLDVPEPPAVLRQDMTVSVDIEVARKPAALLVSSAVVHAADSAAPWVLKLQDGHAVKAAVQLGLRSTGVVEVAQGLAEGDVLVAQSGVQPGDRVRAKAAAQ